MLSERRDLSARSRFAPCRRKKEQLELRTELRIARHLALRERLVDLAVKWVIWIQHEHEPVSVLHEGEEGCVLYRVLDDAIAVRLVDAVSQRRVAFLQLTH